MATNNAFSPVPSLDARPTVSVVAAVPDTATVVGVPVAPTGAVPGAVGLSRERLTAAGFTGAVGETLVIPSAERPSVVAVGVGDRPGPAEARDAAAAFATAASPAGELALVLDLPAGSDVEAMAEAIVEGALLARYGYDALRNEPLARPVTSLALVAEHGAADATIGADRGRVLAAATALARDLANTPHSHLTASRLADLATSLGPVRGLDVEVFDKDAMVEMGIGGILAINAGSSEPPRMVRLTYRPEGTPTGKLALVGKGVMYDSGGLGIKPNDRAHAQMKNDMSGAAAVFAAMLALRELGCRAEVSGFLMCTDNMPSGTAIALGDVVTIRGGKTVEVMDTDAEGRVVISDALVIAAEEGHDAIVDIATLTGAALRALGPDIAALLGNDSALADQVRTASATTGELVWELPLHRPYRRQLDSLVADMANVSYGEAGAITAALFLAEFVGDVPWAHLDIAGPAQVNDQRSWLPAGCSGFGARLLAQFASSFTPPRA